eukprot:g28084.t1
MSFPKSKDFFVVTYFCNLTHQNAIVLVSNYFLDSFLQDLKSQVSGGALSIVTWVRENSGLGWRAQLARETVHFRWYS